jgi:hypothetical protein
VVPSDAVESQRRRRWRSPGRVLLVTLTVVTALFLAWRVAVFLSLEAHFGTGFDDRRFDKLQNEFDRGQAAFTKAEARMRELVATHPQAQRIGWSLMLICVREVGQANACEPTNPDDRKTFAALAGAEVIVHQAKDDGRTFFRFYLNDPPRYTIMYAPDGTDVEAYAQDRGFRSSRPLKPGWAILGPIPDEDRENEQWQ